MTQSTEGSEKIIKEEAAEMKYTLQLSAHFHIDSSSYGKGLCIVQTENKKQQTKTQMGLGTSLVQEVHELKLHDEDHRHKN